MATPNPAVLLAGFITIATLGAVAGMSGTVSQHALVTNHTKAQIEAAGYLNPVADIVQDGDLVIVSGDRDGVKFHTSYVLTKPADGDITLTEHSAVTQNVVQEILFTKVSTKGADAEIARYVANFAGTITKVRSVLNNVLATGDATLQVKINGVNVTNGLVTITNAASAAGDVDVATPTALNAFVAGDVISVVAAGASTATGTANISMQLTPT